MKFDESIGVSGCEVVGVSVANSGSGYTKPKPLNNSSKNHEYEELSKLSIEAISILGHPKATEPLIAKSYNIKVRGRWRTLLIVAEKNDSEVDFVYKLYWMKCESGSSKRSFGIITYCVLIVAIILWPIVASYLCNLAGFDINSLCHYNKINSCSANSSLDKRQYSENEKIKNDRDELKKINEKLGERIDSDDKFYEKLKEFLKYESLEENFDALDKKMQQP